MRFLIIFAVLMALTGCENGAFYLSSKYQLAVSNSGQVYRLNTRSGEVTLIQQTEITGNRIKLSVGSFYETETGDVLLYTGGGKFGPRPPLSSFERK